MRNGGSLRAVSSTAMPGAGTERATSWVCLLLAAVLVAAGPVPVALAADANRPDVPFVAGLEPDRRPPAAPVIRQLRKDTAWYRNALRGIEPPYPSSLRFLEDQGNWYTPFTRPGMPGPYDIRGLHGAR